MLQSHFLNLRSPESLARLAEWVDDEIETETVICPLKDGHRRGGRRLTNLTVALPGRRVEDIVWTWYSECLLTDRVLELFKSSGFTGFEVKPAKARYKRAKEEPPRLWELVVNGSAGVASPESGIKLMEHCPACNLSYYSSCTNPGKLIDVAQWDGTDLFTVWPLGNYIFVTQRAAQMIHHTGLTGAVLRFPGDLDFSGNRTGKISVDLSSYPPPDQRSRGGSGGSSGGNSEFSEFRGHHT